MRLNRVKCLLIGSHCWAIGYQLDTNTDTLSVGQVCERCNEFELEN
jgi:hypothetical protein